MNLRKCERCSSYTLKELCPKCNSKTKDAHYKFIKVRDAPKSDPKYFKKESK